MSDQSARHRRRISVVRGMVFSPRLAWLPRETLKAARRLRSAE